MQTINLIQGSPEWHQHRATHYNASDAPAMLGESPYKTRTELVKQYATGIVPDVAPAVQRRFDDGHRFEELARPLAEKIIGETLFPVTGVLEGTKFSASFDGLNMLEDTAFEHKSLNDTLRNSRWDEGNGWHLPLHHQIQMEQQCMVSGCKLVLFMASKWDSEGNLIEKRHCWYAPDTDLRARIIAGWAQFEKDVETYRANPPAETVKVQAEAVASLPAVAVQLNGKLAVVSNLDKFGDALRTFVERIPTKPTTDQEFANAEAACKTLKQAEDALDAAEAGALAQISDVELLRRTVADLKNIARTARLATEKLVKAEKENRKAQIVTDAQKVLANRIAQINAALAAPARIQMVLGNFGESIKGLKSFDSMQDKVAGQLAAEIAAVENAALKLSNNRAYLLDKDGNDWIFLFADFNTVGTKDSEDFQALAALRIGQHKQAEAARLEAGRERIRQEEAAKLRQEQEAKKKSEAEAEREADANRNGPSSITSQPPVHAGTDLFGNDALSQPASPTRGKYRMAGYTPPTAAELAATDIVDAEITSIEDDGSRIKLGQINSLIAPYFATTADGLSKLGFAHVDTDKNAKLYRECDVPAILTAAIRKLEEIRTQVQEQPPAMAA